MNKVAHGSACLAERFISPLMLMLLLDDSLGDGLTLGSGLQLYICVYYHHSV